MSDALHQFVSRKLPVDAFIFDFEWYTKLPDYDVKPAGESDFTDFGWNPAVFPDPAAQLSELHDAGVRFVGIRKPRLGNADLLKFVRSKDWDFRGGTSYDARDLRYDVPGLRDWYAKQTGPLLRAGIDGWWDDEGGVHLHDLRRLEPGRATGAGRRLPEGTAVDDQPRLPARDGPIRGRRLDRRHPRPLGRASHDAGQAAELVAGRHALLRGATSAGSSTKPRRSC